jgi:hypothetical protein
MARKDEFRISGIFSLAKWRHEERLDEKKQKRSNSEPPAGTGRRYGQGKLHKPPQAQPQPTNPLERPLEQPLARPRNKLRKNVVSMASIPQLQSAPTLYVLEYAPYPHVIRKNKVLGIYSTFDNVTLGALKHGAYTFSRSGILDGSEYLSPTGRIKLVSTTVQMSGVKARLPERSRSLDGEPLRLDIPHPETQKEELKKTSADGKAMYLSVRQSSTIASWIGVFEDKSLAWGACLKDKAMCSMSDTISDEQRSIGVNNMPQISGRLAGSGRFTWLVEQHIIDASEPKPSEDSQPCEEPRSDEEPQITEPDPRTWRDV